MVGEILGPKILGPLCLLIEFTQRKNKLSLIFLTGGSFTTLLRYPLKLSRSHPTETGREGHTFLDNYISMRGLPSP